MAGSNKTKGGSRSSGGAVGDARILDPRRALMPGRVERRTDTSVPMADRVGVVPGKFFMDGKARDALSLNQVRQAVEADIKKSKMNGSKAARREYFLAAGVTTASKNGLATGREPRTAADWTRAYREMVGVLPSDRGRRSRPGVINGIDIHKNFRPWAVFGLNAKTASKADVNRAFKDLARRHHPDAGGRRRDFERLKLMRDSLTALM